MSSSILCREPDARARCGNVFFRLASDNQANAVGAHPFTAAGKAQLLLGGRLDVDLFCIDLAGIGNVFCHLWDIVLELWSLCNDGAIDVGDGISLSLQQQYHLLQQADAVCSGIAWVGVGKMSADVPAAPSRASITACTSTSASE